MDIAPVRLNESENNMCVMTEKCILLSHQWTKFEGFGKLSSSIKFSISTLKSSLGFTLGIFDNA